MLTRQHKYRENIREAGIQSKYEYRVLRFNFSVWELGYRESSPRHKMHNEFTLNDVYSLDVTIGDEISKLSSVNGFNSTC